VLVYRRKPGALPVLTATIMTGDLPHGIWGSGDGGRVYVGLENGDAVQAIDTLRNQVIATIPVGQLPQALASSDDGNANLRPLGEAAHAIHLELIPPHNAPSAAHASVSINSLGPIDNLQVAATGLEPGKAYVLVLLGDGPEQTLLQFRAGIGGVAIVQTLGPLKRMNQSNADSPKLTLQIRSEFQTEGDPTLVQVLQ
jgi:YVTN family beta-propeller protein